jgi:TetR/AcrR family transcriptional regulator, regulator of cefoperazone and chloramphenicol sensitivity
MRRRLATRAQPAPRAKADGETRERLSNVALELFADHGFRKVTVRDISRHARANLAAVSYHFGDKLSLYGELVESAIEMMRSLNDTSIAAARDAPPEEKLRQYIHLYLPRMAHPRGRAALMQRMMRHELSEPTPALRRVLEHGIRPRIRYLSQVIAEMLGSAVDDERVHACVMSVQAQCFFFARERGSADVFGWPMPKSPGELERAAEYVAEFSIAGVRALARRGGKP